MSLVSHDTGEAHGRCLLINQFKSDGERSALENVRERDPGSMVVQLSDTDIARLLAERKALPGNFRQLLQPKPKRGHREHEMSIKSSAGSGFRILIRQSLFNPLDFSVILGYLRQDVTGLFRLKRYNGKSHEHTNKIEGNTFYEFHVHTATERYQDRGMDEDAFAEPTTRFSDLNGAIDCMVADCGFDLSS